MPGMRTERTTIVVGLVLALLLGAGLVLHSVESHKAFTQGPAHARAYLANQIATKGVVQAYAAFVEKNTELPRKDQHANAHLMGEELYKAAGVDTVSVCNSDFGFGCYHGLFGRAISEHGPELIPALDAACIRAFSELGTGCMHGIGHGLMEYVGTKQLARALELCESTTQLMPLLGCTSGVFMEYNAPLGGDENNRTPYTRAFDVARPYEPCDAVDARFQDSCYYELGQWFYDTVSTDTAAVDTFCSGRSGEQRVHCYLGVGASDAIRSEYQPESIIRYCDTFTGEDALMCRAGAAWTLYAIPDYRSRSASLCAYEDEERAARCKERAAFNKYKTP